MEDLPVVQHIVELVSAGCQIGVDDQSVYLLGGDVLGQPRFLEVSRGAAGGAVQDVGNRLHHRFSIRTPLDLKYNG